MPLFHTAYRAVSSSLRLYSGWPPSACNLWQIIVTDARPPPLPLQALANCLVFPDTGGTPKAGKLGCTAEDTSPCFQAPRFLLQFVLCFGGGAVLMFLELNYSSICWTTSTCVWIPCPIRYQLYTPMQVSQPLRASVFSAASWDNPTNCILRLLWGLDSKFL